MTCEKRLNRGVFLISLDFELYWGMRERLDRGEYSENVLGARKAIPAILELFRQYNIRATWATVGLLFFDKRADLIAACPRSKPTYQNTSLSPYPGFQDLGETEVDAPLHFGASLIELIRSYPGQEIGSHTFSHYYCMEPGQTEDQFRDDLYAAVQVANSQGLKIRSLVFPRNQINASYLKTCRSLGICCYRGNEQAWFYADGHKGRAWRLARVARMVDSYLNLSGHNIYTPVRSADGMVDLPASRFLRPYNRRIRCFEPLRRARITRALTEAAAQNKTYHLWWHPHNFGVNLEENVAFLRTVLDRFNDLKERYGMESLSMAEAAGRVKEDHVA